MARRSQPGDSDVLVRELTALVAELPSRLQNPSIAERVTRLVEIQRVLRSLGASLAASLDSGPQTSGRARVLAYLRLQTGRIVHTEELNIVSGIGDYARRIRELRTLAGWPIISGSAMRDVSEDMIRRGLKAKAPPQMAVDEYVLVEDCCDVDAIRRWRRASAFRARHEPLRDRVIAYFEESTGARVTAEELRYAAKDTGEWIHALASLAERGRIIRGYQVDHEGLPWGMYILDPQQPK